MQREKIMPEPQMKAHVAEDGTETILDMMDVNGLAFSARLGPDHLDDLIVLLTKCAKLVHQRIRETAHNKSRTTS